MKIGKVRIGPGDLVETEDVELAPDEIEQFEKMIRASIELKNTPAFIIPLPHACCFVIGCKKEPSVVEIPMPSGELLTVRVCESHAAYMKDVWANCPRG